MAVIRQRINRKNAAGTYDTIRLETDSSLVLRANGHNLETDSLFKLAKYYPDGSGVNLDTVLDGLMLIHSSDAKGCPVTAGYLYIVQLFYSDVSATAPHIQIAFPYTASSQHAAAFRTYYSGWSSWEKIYTNNAKPTATDIGAAPTSHTHAASAIASGILPIARGGTGNAAGQAATALSPVVQDIAANTDLNNIKTPGWYKCPASATVQTLKNSPISNIAFSMVVLQHAGVMQIVTLYPTNQPTIYVRNYYSNTWGAWYCLYSTCNKPTPASIGAAAASHGTHVTFTTTVPKAAGTAAVGSATTVSRSDHVHPAQTSITGNAGTATKLAVARTFRTNLGSTSTASFDGSASVTPGVTGTLPVANGGTGVTSITALKTTLGLITSSGIEIDLSLSVGTRVKWGGYYWIVVHKSNGRMYLALDHVYELCTFGSTNVYKGSNLAARCTAFANTIPAATLAKAVNTTVNGVTAKMFACSYEQANGGFDYFSSNTNRLCKDSSGVARWWWTSSPGSGDTKFAGTVSDYGSPGYVVGGEVTKSLGLRPFVALNQS